MPIFINRQPFLVCDHVQWSGVRQIQSRTAISQRRYRLELHRIRISRSCRNLPIASGEIWINHLFRGEIADSHSRAVPHVVMNRQLDSGTQIISVKREPCGASLREAGGEVMTASCIGYSEG